MFSRRYSIVCICSRFECPCPQSQGIFYLYNTLYTGIRILSDCGGESILGGSQAAGDHKAHAQRLFHTGEQEEVHQHQWAGVPDAGWHFRCTNSDYMYTTAYSSNVNRSVIPVESWPLAQPAWAFSAWIYLWRSSVASVLALTEPSLSTSAVLSAMRVDDLLFFSHFFLWHHLSIIE